MTEPKTDLTKVEPKNPEPDTPLSFRPATDDEAGDFCLVANRAGQFAELFGVHSDEVANASVNALLGACGFKEDSTPETMVVFMNEASEILHSVKPKDALEGLLATQMVATHKAALVCFRQAAFADNVDNHMRKINLATKLTRTFTAQMEALAKYRNKGKQRITVEHVEVKDGGQAVIGNIDGTGGGGGQ